MKITKKQFINLTKEVTDEVITEALSAVVPRRPQESVSESPQKNLPGSDPDKWKDISGARQQKPVSQDIGKFAQEILEKIKARQRKR